MNIGASVVFTDEYGNRYYALLTQIWGSTDDMENNPPSVNLVFVSNDDTKTDPYGRQIDRRTSVVHESRQSAHGFFYSRLPETQ